MDETKGTEQDSSQVTEDTSGGSEGTTPKAEKTFTEQEAQKLVNDTLAAKGRDAKRLTDWESNLKVQEEANRAANIALEQQRKEAQRKELEDLADSPDLRTIAERRHQQEDRERQFEQEQKAKTERWDIAIDFATRHGLDATKLLADVLSIERPESMTGVLKKWDRVLKEANEHGLNPNDLLDADTPRHMEDIIKRLEAEKKEVKPQPSEKEGFPKPDSGTSDAGGDSDEAFQKGWNAGDIPATKENIARAQKIINK